MDGLARVVGGGDGGDGHLVGRGADLRVVGEAVEEPAQRGAHFVGTDAAVSVGVEIPEERGILVERAGGGGRDGPERVVDRERVAQVRGSSDREVVGLAEFVEFHGRLDGWR